jgi:hypothetical protein
VTEPDFAAFLKSVVGTLERLGLTYAIGGSVASSIYGDPRSTRDVDISVVLPLDDAYHFTTAFEQLGYYCPLDVVLDAFIAAQPFNIIDASSGFKADIFLVSWDAPSQQEREIMQRRRRQVYDDRTRGEAALYSPEDVIVYKLKYYLMGQISKHLRDIAGILAAQEGRLDLAYIDAWAQRIGAGAVWEQVLAAFRDSQSSH